MRYDDGYGRHGGWEQRMPDGGRGFDRGYPDPRRGGDAADRPWVGGYREGYQGGSGGYALRTTGPLYESYGAHGSPDAEREHGRRRPRGEQGQRQGNGYFVRARAGGYGGDYRGGGDRWAYEDAQGDTDFGPSGARPGFGELGHLQGGRGGYDRQMRGGGGYGRDFGEGYDRGMRGGGGGYDLPFRNEGRPEDYHPRYSPVGGTYAPMGGSRATYRAGEVPRALTDTWTSNWTRWF
jgi:hypothetical protein